MGLGEDICVPLRRAFPWGRSEHWRYLAYAAGLLLLTAFVFACKPFWLTNDDVSMAMISNGTGIAAAPSPRLVLTNIAWGYLIGSLPHFQFIQPYTLMTYLALALSYCAILHALLRSRLNPLMGAALLLVIYAPTLVYPQYTLVAGYLACAGIVLLCMPVEEQSRASIACAGILMVLSGLVRADETLLVMLATAPLALGYWLAAGGKGIRRHWLIMAVIVAVAFVGFQLWDYAMFSAGAWAEYGRTYALRTEFTDFNLAGYYWTHKQAVAALGAGYSGNDLRLFQDWFYADPRVFSPHALGHVVHDIPLRGRLEANLRLSYFCLKPFRDTQVQALAVALLAILLIHRRWGFTLAAIAGLVVIMLLLLALGRPGVTRIYVPVFAALVLVGAMQPLRQFKYVAVLPVLACMACMAGAVWVLHDVHGRNRIDAFDSRNVRAKACRMMNHAPILVVWGSDYPYSLEFLPFAPAAQACPTKIYALGEFSLAPYSMEQLFSVTQGRDLVQALLAGQSFDFVAKEWELSWLDQYFQEHYASHLAFKQIARFPGYGIFRVMKQEEPPGLPLRSEGGGTPAAAGMLQRGVPLPASGPGRPVRSPVSAAPGPS